MDFSVFAEMTASVLCQFHSIRTVLLVIALMCGQVVAVAQQGDKEKDRNGKERGNGKELALKLIDQFYRDTLRTLKSENAYLKYEGKTIRNILLEHYGFERSLYDTSRRKVVNDVVRFGNSLHVTTRDQIIRNHLFLREGRPLNPYKVADNERLLRDLDFILDARIVVRPVEGNPDEVEIVVITRDVFSLGASFSPSSATKTQFGLYDVNIDGRGQEARINNLIDTERDPRYGYQLLYSKRSIEGSFINATVSYTKINNGASYGFENENALYLRFDRPLISPYTRFAGGFELSRNWSVNAYQKTTTDFRDYHYYVTDFWMGYNIGVKNKTGNRNRHFVAFRTFDQRFTLKPEQENELENPVYNNRVYILGEVSFFNQNFYKTRYIYGFGRTEDVPYGKQFVVLAGWEKQLGLTRPYVGAEITKTLVRSNGDFHSYSVRVGGFRKDDDFEDVIALASASLFSKPLLYRKFIIRQSVSLNYTTILKQAITPLLEINNDFGVRGFTADSLMASKRLGITTETVVFTPWKLAGFRFAPFVAIDMALAAPKGMDLWKAPAWFGLGGGIRTRNENLVFGTIELRMYYFPKIVDDISTFKVSLRSNLRIKYSSGFVRAPEFIRYN
jgi:hypothetical protein